MPVILLWTKLNYQQNLSSSKTITTHENFNVKMNNTNVKSVWVRQTQINLFITCYWHYIMCINLVPTVGLYISSDLSDTVDSWTWFQRSMMDFLRPLLQWHFHPVDFLKTVAADMLWSCFPGNQHMCIWKILKEWKAQDRTWFLGPAVLVISMSYVQCRNLEMSGYRKCPHFRSHTQYYY